MAPARSIKARCQLGPGPNGPGPKYALPGLSATNKKIHKTTIVTQYVFVRETDNWAEPWLGKTIFYTVWVQIQPLETFVVMFISFYVYFYVLVVFLRF